MVRFRHAGCQSEVIRYVGQQQLQPGLRMDRDEWQFPNGRHPKDDDPIVCPDCGKLVPLNSPALDRISEAVEA